MLHSLPLQAFLRTEVRVFVFQGKSIDSTDLLNSAACPWAILSRTRPLCLVSTALHDQACIPVPPLLLLQAHWWLLLVLEYSKLIFHLRALCSLLRLAQNTYSLTYRGFLLRISWSHPESPALTTLSTGAISHPLAVSVFLECLHLTSEAC